MSLVPILIRTTSANEFTIGVARIAIALLLVSPVALWRQKITTLRAADWINLAVVGAVFGCHWLTYFISIKTANASVAAIAISTYGIHLLILNWLIKKQQIAPLEWLAVLLCFVGVILVAPEFSLSNQITVGMLIGVVSGFLYACLPLLHQRMIAVPTATRAWGQFLFAGIIFFPFIPMTDWQLNTTDWWCLILLGVVCTVIGHSLWVKVSSELPGVITGVVYYLYVPIALLTSFFWLGESLTWNKILGACCIVGANIGVALFTWYRHRKI
ncbi:DMT family transporter [Aurantivibrio plasticivorans]